MNMEYIMKMALEKRMILQKNDKNNFISQTTFLIIIKPPHLQIHIAF